MRISDWSSDGCSSDLGGTAIGASASADGFAATATGVGAYAPGEQASAFGAVSNAIGDYSTSVGTQSAATGTSSVALGGPIDLIPGLGFFIDTPASGEAATALSAGSIASADYAETSGTLTAFGRYFFRQSWF